MNEMKNGIYTYNGEEIAFEFNCAPSYAVKSLFVNSVVNSVVDENYNYILKDLIFNYMIVSIFTNIDMSHIEQCGNPIETISLIEDIVENTNIIDIVKENLGDDIVNELMDAVEKGIEYKTGIHISLVEKELSELLKMVNGKMGKLGNDLNPDDTKKFMDLVLNMKGEFTPDKILDAYANTDMFKSKYADILEKHEE